MPIGIHRELDRIVDTARTRRAHLSSRAVLALLMRTAHALSELAAQLRGVLDPAGGAEAHPVEP